MSVLIDWYIPKACRDCSLQIGGYCQMYSDDMRRLDDVNLIVERPDWCPLIEIPTPHGDLVDRTELLAEYDRQHKGPAGGARRIMEQATAVIKAEE